MLGVRVGDCVWLALLVCVGVQLDVALLDGVPEGVAGHGPSARGAGMAPRIRRAYASPG